MIKYERCYEKDVVLVGRGSCKGGPGPLRPRVDGLAVVGFVMVPMNPVVIGRRILSEHSPDQGLVLVDEHVDPFPGLHARVCYRRHTVLKQSLSL